MEQKHVLIIPSWYPIAENSITGSFFKEQGEALSEIGVKVGVIYPEIRPISSAKFDLFCKNHFQVRCYEEQGVRVVRMHGWNKFPKFPKQEGRYWVKQALKLFNIYVKNFGKPDIIHAHSALWGGYAASLISEKYNIPYVLTEHSSAFVLQKIAQWKTNYAVTAFEKAQTVFAVSKFFAESLKYYTDREIKVMPNMVDTDLFMLGEENGFSDLESFQFCSVAGLNKNKGMDIVIRGFYRAFGNNPKIKLAIGGGGPDLENLKDIIKELKLENRATLMGTLQREEVSVLMRQSQCFVLASQYETFGVVVIEALASGIPVICTRCGGPEEVVTKEVGILVEKDNIEALACGIPVISTRCGGPEEVVTEEVGILTEKNNIEALGQAMEKIYNNYEGYNNRNIANYIINNYGRAIIASNIEKEYTKILKSR